MFRFYAGLYETLKRRRISVVLITALLPFLSACSVIPSGFYYYGPSLPHHAPSPEPVERLQVPKRFIAQPEHFYGFVAEGKVAVYAAQHEGHLTALGVSLENKRFTAAHKSLPLGAKVRITNVRSGRAVVAIINDRMSADSKYLLTVTQSIARELQLSKQSLQNDIKIEVVA